MTHAGWLYFAKFIVAAFVVFYLKCLVLGISSSGFVESGPRQAVEEAQEMATGHLLCSLGPHNHGIHRRVFNSTVKLIVCNWRPHGPWTEIHQISMLWTNRQAIIDNL
jgi:hypothetical protein